MSEESQSATETPIETHEEWAQRITRERMIVSPFQARSALKQAGLLGQVEQLMGAPETEDTTRLAWQMATEFRRLSPTIDAIAQRINLSDEQLDDLFAAAAKIIA